MPGVFTPIITLQRTSVTSVGHSSPERLEVLYAGATKTRGTGTACIYPPGPSGNSVRLCHNTRKFCEFCKTRATMPRERVQHVLNPPGTSVSSACLCHNTRNFWKFCNSSIPIPETSGSSIRPPYPYPESTNPTELEVCISFSCAARSNVESCPRSVANFINRADDTKAVHRNHSAPQCGTEYT